MSDGTAAGFSLSCPMPISRYEQVLLAHGGGGKLTHQLVEMVFGPAFANPLLDARHDGAVAGLPGGARIAFTTDSYVVRPLFFPGGDIGSLAVNGTVNDLAMCGATPLYLSGGFILEEGLPMETLCRVVASMRDCALAAGVQIVTGDTKVVDRGKADGLFITTAGVGVIDHGLTVAPSAIRDGDAVVLSGDVGRHGIAIMAQREGLSFETEIESDCAPVNAVVRDLLAAGLDVHCLRDLTRGGLATALAELAETSGAEIRLEEALVPVREDVRGACEILGFDPLYVANEGRFITILPEAQAGRAVEVMRRHAPSAGAVVAGRVGGAMKGVATLRSSIGATRVLDMLSGEQLPRIC
jgi:hydrogenase expression/formation protein HypE